MPGLSEEDEKIIDLKLENVKNEMEKKLVAIQSPYNVKICEMHQEIVGYAGRPGISSKLECFEERIEATEAEIKELKENQSGKIETRKAFLGMIGSGGFVGLLVWLSQLFGGPKP